jgi:plastocyanin domain-containing protein
VSEVDGIIYNVEFYYNAELPYTDSQFCEDYRKVIPVVIVVLASLCFGIVVIATFYYLFIRKQPSGSGDKNVANSNNTQEMQIETTTVIEEPV